MCVCFNNSYIFVSMHEAHLQIMCNSVIRVHLTLDILYILHIYNWHNTWTLQMTTITCILDIKEIIYAIPRVNCACIIKKRSHCLRYYQLYIVIFWLQRFYRSFYANVNLKNGQNEIVFDRLWYPLSILLLAAIWGPHGGLQVDK